jgi:translation initiation factor 2 beta subunit (eIF-2beta)/eIF-5
MSKQVAIPNNTKTQQDLFYRYKRDKINLTKSGEFFVIANIDTVLKSLNLDVTIFIKYLQKKIGQTVIQDKKTNQIKLKGNSDVDAVLEQYILETIICKKCNLPEYYNDVCKSCGFKK